MITQDVKTLIEHINYIASNNGLAYYVSATSDLITIKDKIKLKLHYLLHTSSEEPTLIVTSTIEVPCDKYLDEKDNIVEGLNYHFYNQILTHTEFQSKQNNIDDKYKWN